LFEGRVAPNPVVPRDHGLPGMVGQPGHDLGGDTTVIRSLGGERVAPEGPSVLRFARDVVLLGHLLRGLAHRFARGRLGDGGRDGDEIAGSDPAEAAEPGAEGLRLARLDQDVGEPAGGEDRNVGERLDAWRTAVRWPAPTASGRPLPPAITSPSRQAVTKPTTGPAAGPSRRTPTSEAPFSHRTRAAALESMAHEAADLLVIGGGITGAATAREAALRGFRTALVAKG